MASPNTRRNHYRKLMAAQEGKCCYCERHVTPRSVGKRTPATATLEHLKRQADGGTSRLGNLAVACFECNTGRGAVDWLTYKSYRMGELAVSA